MELLFVVAAIVIMLFGFSLLYLELRRRSLQEKNDMLLRQKEIELLRQQVAANQTKEQTLLLKSQETSTSVDALNRQFQQLYRQIIQLERDTVVLGETIEHVRQQVSAMNQVMINKKARGNWGEYQLQMLLELYAGECREVYETQYKLDNGTIGDVALHLAGSSQVMIIDSKFPMENYQAMADHEGDAAALQRSENLFRTSIKKHINDIAKKYINAQTCDQAVMFVPSEAVYMYICSKCSDLLDYAFAHHVLITSPTTLIGVVFTLVHATKDYRRSVHVKQIEQEIIALKDDSRRLVQRLEKSANAMRQSLSALEETQISAQKIFRRIEKVSEGETKNTAESR